MNSLTQKRCTACGEIKNKSEFSPDPRKPIGVQPKCKKCTAEWMKQYRKNNPDLIRESKKRYQKEHPETKREGSKRFYKAHPERHKRLMQDWYQRNAESYKEYARAWRDRNPDKVRAFAWNRREKVRAAKGNGVTGEQWRELQDDYLGLCVYCGSKTRLTLDHVTPLYNSGENDISNAAPACKKCNSSKGTKSLLMFLYSLVKR